MISRAKWIVLTMILGMILRIMHGIWRNAGKLPYFKSEYIALLYFHANLHYHKTIYTHVLYEYLLFVVSHMIVQCIYAVILTTAISAVALMF